MESTSLMAVADEQLAAARAGHSGRAAHTVLGGHERALRQTVIALRAGQDLAEHDSPEEATLQVLVGSVRLVVGDEQWRGSAGDLAVIPQERHSLHADEDSAVLLTVYSPR